MLRYTVTKLKVRSARDGLRLDRSAAREQIEAAIADPAGAAHHPRQARSPCT